MEFKVVDRYGVTILYGFSTRKEALLWASIYGPNGCKIIEYKKY